MMSSRVSVRSPIREIAPSFCLPPVDACFGTSPSQAAKSRPFANVSACAVIAAIAVAVIGPMPGMVISRRATSPEASAASCRRFEAAVEYLVTSPPTPAERVKLSVRSLSRRGSFDGGKPGLDSPKKGHRPPRFGPERRASARERSLGRGRQGLPSRPIRCKMRPISAGIASPNQAVSLPPCREGGAEA